MIVVLADDLSGAAELAGIAVHHGLRVELQTAFAPPTGVDVVCVTTDSRSLPPAQAAEVAGAAARKIVAAKPAWIFKKCDSVLRGPVVAEARAMAQAVGLKKIVLVPANPSRERIIRNGRYFVRGKPLNETEFAGDPVHPRRTAVVTELLGGDLAGIELPDISSAADVEHQAARVDDATLPTGAADFFTALLRWRVQTRPAAAAPTGSVPGPTLVVCGSSAAWPQRHATARQRNIPAFALPHALGALGVSLRTSPRVLIGIGDGPATQGKTAEALERELADSVAKILNQSKVGRLFLEGGATAAAVVRAMGWNRFRARSVAGEGVGGFQPVGAAGPLLFIKPGSYAWPAGLWPGLS